MIREREMCDIEVMTMSTVDRWGCMDPGSVGTSEVMIKMSMKIG